MTPFQKLNSAPLPATQHPVAPTFTPNPFKKLRQKQFIFIVLGIGLVISLSIALFLYFSANIENEPLSSILLNNAPSSINKPLEKGVDKILYTVGENGFNEVATFKALSPYPSYTEVQPYLDEPKGLIYLGNQESLFVYDLNTKEQKAIYTLSEQYLDISRVFGVDDKLYISLTSNIGSGDYIDEFDINTKNSRRIGPQENVIFGGLHYIFKTTTNDDVTASFGGDGCGNYGELRLVTANGTNLITKTGGGCAEESRYIASLASENKIVLLSTAKGTYEDLAPQLDTLYTKDVYTREKKDLLDLKPLTNKLHQYLVDQKNSRLYLIFKDEVWDLNLLSGQIENKSAISKDLNIENEYYSVFFYNKLYSLKEEPHTNDFNMSLKTADVSTGAIKEYDWGEKYPISGTASLLGFWQNQPLIYLYISSK